MAEQSGVDNTLKGGSFYGAVQRRQELCDAIFTDLRHTAPKRLPEHAHELSFFALLLDGSYGERYGHKSEQHGPLTVMYRPAGIPHQDEIGPNGVKFFEIEIKPSWAQRMTDYPATLDLPQNEAGGGDMLWLAIKIYRQTRIEDSHDDLAIESLLAELVGQAARLRPDQTKEAPGWLSRVVDKLSTEYRERITLDQLSAEAGVHAVHLSRVFRKCRGEGIGEFVQRLRIRAACEQLLRCEFTLADISASNGFADQSHFTRWFRRVTGMSPARFRAMVTA